MRTTIDIHALPAQFAEMLALAEEGNEVIVTENDVPRAVLDPIPVPTWKPRILGLGPGSITMNEDFNVPLPDEFWLGER
jgi:antitoxin (DNA-binding transcriptional repressor) of toxin-antitoxin stability system